MIKKILTKEKALERLKGLCSRSEQCEFDIIRKMINWGISSSDRKDIIEFLITNRFIDDERFARSYTNDKARFSSWGPNKIKTELIKRKIKNEFINKSINNVGQEVWKKSLLKNAETKAKNLDLNGEAGNLNCQKIFRYLIARGYPASISSKAVNLMKKRQNSKS